MYHRHRVIDVVLHVDPSANTTFHRLGDIRVAVPKSSSLPCNKYHEQHRFHRELLNYGVSHFTGTLECRSDVLSFHYLSLMNRLTIFIIAIVDWFMGSAFAFLTVVGGVLIIAAFILLSYASWKEIQEDKMVDMEQGA